MLFAYCRVSTLEQISGTSPEEQERQIQGCAMMRGAADVVFYRDLGVSGTIPLAQRAAGAKLLKEVESGDVVVASKLDRMFRSAEDALVTARKFKERGVALILLNLGTEPVTGEGLSKVFFGMLALFAELEREMIAGRMNEGRRSKLLKGGFPGGKAPYGWSVEGKGRQAVLVPRADEQAILLEVRELVGQCANLYQVAKTLNERGRRNREGGSFQRVQIARIVQTERVFTPVLVENDAGGIQRDLSAGLSALSIGGAVAPAA